MNAVATFDRLSNLPISKITWMPMSMFSNHSSASNDDLPLVIKGDPFNCQTSLLSIIEVQIIPRLLKAERVSGTFLSLVPASRAMPSKQEIETFVNLCTSHDPFAGQVFVNQ